MIPLRKGDRSQYYSPNLASLPQSAFFWLFLPTLLNRQEVRNFFVILFPHSNFQQFSGLVSNLAWYSEPLHSVSATCPSIFQQPTLVTRYLCLFYSPFLKGALFPTSARRPALLYLLFSLSVHILCVIGSSLILLPPQSFPSL